MGAWTNLLGANSHIRNFVNRSSSLTQGLQLSVRAALAAGLAVSVAQLLRLQFPIYAMIAAVIVTDFSPAQTRRLAAPRLAGTVVGSTAGAVLSPILHAGPSALVFAIFSSMFVCHLLHLKDAAKLAGFVSGIVLLDHSGGPWSYAWYRLLETAVGVGMAVLVSLVPKLIRQ